MTETALVTNPAIGLCAACEHCRMVQAARSTFYMCQRSFTQPEFPKYPRLPVIRCAGFDPRRGGEGGVPDDKLKG
jgi:hypothetical protein